LLRVEVFLSPLLLTGVTYCFANAIGLRSVRKY
jgi:hypothetical protein